MKKIIHLIAATRPNFMKIAPLFHALSQERWALPRIIHTGQHYDYDMSDTFFSDLNLPKPHFNLRIGSGTHAEQTGKVMIAYERLVVKEKPDLVVVVGDVNSTLAVALVVAKLGIKSAHLEAGLRSFDRRMPEEINRIVTDSLADLLWTPSPDGDKNLISEGIHREKIKRVGNIMIDSLEMMSGRIKSDDACVKLGLNSGRFGLITLHRPANADNIDMLSTFSESLMYIAEKIPIIFPVHPRTKKNLISFNLYKRLGNAPGVHLLRPLSYIPFMNLVFNCKFVITDSGGLQEETTYLNIPCLTLRPNTERPITITKGTNSLCQITEINNKVDEILKGKIKIGKIPKLWDGLTAVRVVKSIRDFLAV